VTQKLSLADIVATEVQGQSASQAFSDSSVKLAGEAFLHTAVQEPLDGVVQLLNHTSTSEKPFLSSPRLFDAPKAATFGTQNWLAETVGSGFGAVLPYLLVEGATRGSFAKIGTLVEGSNIARSIDLSAEGVSAASTLAKALKFSAPAAKMAVNGAIYGSVFTPSADDGKGFWKERATSAESSALTFGAMGLTSSAVMAGAQKTFGSAMAEPSFALSLKGIGLRLSANAVGGATGGAVSAESHSVLSGKGNASREQIVQSMAQYLVTGVALDGAHLSADYYRAAKQLAEQSAAHDAVFRPKLTADDEKMLDNIQKSHFQYFREQSDPVTGLTKDRSTETSAASIAAVGFSLTAHGVGVDRGWISREDAADYTLKVLNNLWSTKQGPEPTGTSGEHGLFYHFLDPKTGLRAGQNEVSTIDTALLMAGVLYSKNYFNGTGAKEVQIRDLADKLYNRVDWTWALNDKGRLSMGWEPESGFLTYDWQAYNEGQILLLMAMGSPTHPIPASAWETYMSTAKPSENYGQTNLAFGPMFAHQYTQIWTDFRGNMDATNKKLGFDYFENSRRATLAQHTYAIDNPQLWKGYSALDWGLTASDGPADVTKIVDGRQREFHTYNARGVPGAPDDGTIAPTAAAGSLPFAPDIVLPTLRHWLTTRPEIYGRLGFTDAFNPTFDMSKPSGWVDQDRLGIDQGPILLMTENFRTDSIWNTMRGDFNLQSALDKAGFSRKPSPPAGVTALSRVIGKLTGN
jgi:hypothetical protein